MFLTRNGTSEHYHCTSYRHIDTNNRLSKTINANFHICSALCMLYPLTYWYVKKFRWWEGFYSEKIVKISGKLDRFGTHSQTGRRCTQKTQRGLDRQTRPHAAGGSPTGGFSARGGHSFSGNRNPGLSRNKCGFPRNHFSKPHPLETRQLFGNIRDNLLKPVVPNVTESSETTMW